MLKDLFLFARNTFENNVILAIKPQVIALTIIGLIVLVLLVIITIVGNKRITYDKTIQKLETEINMVDETKIIQKLGRLKEIGENSVVYQKTYVEQNNHYKRLKADHLPTLKENIEKLKAAVLKKDYRYVNLNLKVCVKLHNAYLQKVYEFDQGLSLFTKKDDNLKGYEDRLRLVLNRCREIYSANKTELTIVDLQLTEKFNTIDDKFAHYKEQLKNGNYSDAEDYLRSLDKDLNELYGILQSLPKYSSLILENFPPRLNKIIEVTNKMQSEGYPLYHITPGKIINNIKEELTKSINAIKNFNLEGLEQRFNDLNNAMNELQGKLEKEIIAKREFDLNFDTLYTEAEALEKDFIRHMREIKELNQIYDISKQSEEFSGVVKTQVNRLSTVRRELENYNYSNNPYLMRYNKMKELQEVSNSLKTMLGNFKTEVKGMKDTSENAHDLIRNAATHLKNLELSVRNFQLDKFILKYKRSFSDGYEIIEKLSRAIVSEPIRIKLVNELKDKLDELLRTLDERVNRDLNMCRRSEEAILRANNHRSSFSSVDSNISKAETLFFEARFEEALALAEESLREIGAIIQKQQKGSHAGA